MIGLPIVDEHDAGAEDVAGEDAQHDLRFGDRRPQIHRDHYGFYRARDG